MTPIVYFNGEYLSQNEARVSPEDRAFVFGDGIYEVIRSYDGSLFALDAHLARMRRGVCELAINGVDVDQMGDVAAELIARNGLSAGDATVYMQVTRGAAPRTHFFPDPAVPPTVYAQAGRFTPKGDPVKGIAALSVPDVRWARCDIKTLQLLPNVLANQRAHAAGVAEALFVRDGVILEGSHSSLFFVFGEEVRTAPKTNYILPSITRDVVLELCHTNGIAARETPVFLHEVAQASEAFLAGTTVEVMPIVRIDATTVGSGKPGPVTRRLQGLFRARVQAGRADTAGSALLE
jgi:D-alanine transaminase